MMPVMKSVVATAAVVLSLTTAKAATVNVSGTGLFGKSAPTTAESAPGQTFAFTFRLEDPLAGSTVSNLLSSSYLLAGLSISPTITSITFHDSTENGLFDIAFSDSNVISLYGDNILVDGHLQSDVYFAQVGIEGSRPVGRGAVTVSETVSPVPLPGSAPLFGASLLTLGAAGFVVKRAQRANAGSC